MNPIKLESVTRTNQEAISVLLVVKDAEQRDNMSSVIHTIPYINLLIVEGSSEAAGILKLTGRYRPDILITDDFFEENDTGIDIASLCIERNSNAVVIMTSGSKDRIFKKKLAEAGCYCLIRKPVNYSKFKRIVSSYVHILNAVRHSNACGTDCNGSCRLLNHVVSISTVQEIITFGKCLNRINENSGAYRQRLNLSRVTFLYDFLYSVVDCGLKINLIYYKNDNVITCMFSVDGILKALVKNSDFYRDHKDCVHFGNKTCAIVISGNFDPAEEPIRIRFQSNYKSDADKLGAVEFMNSLPPEQLEDIDLLFEYTDMLYPAITELAENNNLQNLYNVKMIILRIIRGLNIFSHFDSLCDSLKYLCETIENIEEQSEVIKYDTLSEFLLLFEEDITNWINDVFREKTAKDIKYMNESIIASVMQFEQTYYGAPIIPVSDTDIEFF